MPLIINTLILFLFSINSSLAAENVKIRNARIHEAPPAIRVFAAYLDIINENGKDMELVSASSPAFEKTEFHVTRIEQGISSMHRQATILIPAKSIFSFSPGQYHLMLFNNNRPILRDDIIPLDLVFSDGENIRTGMHVVPVDSTEHNQNQER